MRDRIGKLKIDIEANTEGVKAGVSDAKREVEGLGDEAERAGKRTESGFNRAGEAISSATAPVRKFASSITETIGIVTGLIGVVTLLSGAISQVRKTSSEFRDAIRGVTAARDEQLQKAVFQVRNEEQLAKSLQDIRKQELKDVQEITEALDLALDRQGGSFAGELTQSLVSFLFGVPTNEDLVTEAERATATVRRTYDELAAIAREQSEAAMAADKALLERREKAFADSQARIQEQLQLELATDQEDRIRRQAEIQKNALIRAAREAGIAIEDVLLQSNLATIDEIARRQTDALRKANQEALAERERREKEANDRIAKAQREAIEREFRGLAQSLNGIFGGDGFTTKLDQVIAEVRRASHEIRGLK